MAWKCTIIVTTWASCTSTLSDENSRATSSELVSLGRYHLARSDCLTAVSLFNESLLLQNEQQHIMNKARAYVSLVEAVQCATQGQSKEQRQTLFTDLYRRMTNVIGSDVSATEHPKFYYALCQVAEVVGQYKDSYRYLEEANRAAKQRMHSFDERALEGEIELAKAVSTPEVRHHLDVHRQSGPSSSSTGSPGGAGSGSADRYGRGKGLIFVVGFPQSGMDYLERLLVAWAADGAVFSLNSDLAYYHAVADKIDSRVQEGFIGPYATQIERELGALLFAKTAGELSHADWPAVLQLVEQYGTSVEHNMRAVRAYAIRALGMTLTNGQHLVDTDIANYKHLGEGTDPLASPVYSRTPRSHLSRLTPLPHHCLFHHSAFHYAP